MVLTVLLIETLQNWTKNSELLIATKTKAITLANRDRRK